MDNKKDQEKKISSIKLIIIGSVNVGKTSLLTRYATGKFTQVTKSTSNASFISKIKVVNNKKYEIKLWDTAGQEKYRSLTKIFTKEAKIALLVYAIDDIKSFNDLNTWLNIVRETNTEKIILGVAANKADLYKNAVITDEQGKQYAKEIGAIWRSTSCLLDDCGIDYLVDELFEKYIEEKRLKKTGSFNIPERVVLNNKAYENDKKSVCCAGKKDKNKSKNKSIKNIEVLENNEKHKNNEDEDL